MNTLYIKNFFKWLIIFIICFTFFFAIFIPDYSFNNKKDFIKIDKYSFKESDLKNIVINIIQNNKKIKKINSIENKLSFLIKYNILFNINLLKINLTVSKKEMFNTLFKAQIFNANGVFSVDLYKFFLEKNNIIDLDFQESLKKESIQNQIKKCLLLIEKNKSFKNNSFVKFHKFNFIYKKNNFKKSINLKKKLLNYFLSNSFNYKYLEFSVKSFKNKILLNNNKLFNFYNEKQYIYSKQNIFKLNYNFFGDNYKNKKIFITKDELNILNREKINNILINNDAKISFIIKSKNGIYNLNKINQDLINKYIKQKIYNYLKKKIIKKQNIKINFFIKNFYLRYRIFNLLDNDSFILLKRYLKFSENFNNLIKINKNKYLFFLKSDNNKIKLNKLLNLFINKKKYEKNILIDFLKFKKKKNIKIKWNNKITNLKKKRRIYELLTFKNNKNIFIKYKNNYYFINDFYFDQSNNFYKQYFLIKQSILN